MTSVLVIDDDADVREMLCQILSEFGYKVSAAPNGNLGLESYQTEPVSVVLLDMFMPGEHGLETLRDLLRHDPNARVIAMTGGGQYDQMEILKPAIYMGARKKLQKPFTSAELKSAIEEAILMPNAKSKRDQAGDDPNASSLPESASGPENQYVARFSRKDSLGQ